VKETTGNKIKTLNSLEEVEGWRWCVRDLRLRNFEDGEVEALLLRELQLKERKK